MKIGVAREIKKHEYRVGMTPADAHQMDCIPIGEIL